MTDFYEILEVEKTSTDDEIKKAYRRLALKVKSLSLTCVIRFRLLSSGIPIKISRVKLKPKRNSN